MRVVVREWLYLNAARDRLVMAGHPDAAYLLAAEGQEVDEEQLTALGYKAPTTKAPKPEGDKQIRLGGNRK